MLELKPKEVSFHTSSRDAQAGGLTPRLSRLPARLQDESQLLGLVRRPHEGRRRPRRGVARVRGRGRRRRRPRRRRGRRRQHRLVGVRVVPAEAVSVAVEEGPGGLRVEELLGRLADGGEAAVGARLTPLVAEVETEPCEGHDGYAEGGGHEADEDAEQVALVERGLDDGLADGVHQGAAELVEALLEPQDREDGVLDLKSERGSR